MIKSITKTDIGFIVLLLAIATIGINSGIKRRNLNKNSKYTIGISTRVTYDRFGAPHIYYKYSVGGVEFKSSHLLDDEKLKKGQKHYVMFQSNNPQNSQLMTNKPVIGNIDSIPLNGWNELPQIVPVCND